MIASRRFDPDDQIRVGCIQHADVA